MKKKKIEARFPKSKKILLLVALIALVGIITALFSSLSVRVNAKETLTFSGFPIPHNSYPMDITSGPDGNIWFTESWRNTIGRMTPNGTLTEFPLSSINNRSLTSITTGPDGNLWFTYSPPYENKIGKITPNGTITEFTIPPYDSTKALWDITTGPDGNLWFTERQGNQIGRITPNGAITEFPLPTTGSPLYITTGPDGNLWFTEQNDKIGRITPDGNISEFPVPTKDSTPWDITTGPDGNIWFTEKDSNKIGKITVDGKITEFSTHNTNQPFRITTGPDGNLWFTEILANKLGRITTHGVVTEFQIPEIFAQPWGRPDSITTGSDGNLWFTEFGGDMIGRVNLVDLKDPGPPDRDFTLLSPFNNGVTWTVSSGYYNNRNQTSTGCHIGTGPDHCRNQLFGLDMVPDQQSDKKILAPGNGKVSFKGKLEGGCVGLRITLDNGLNLNVCHFATWNVSTGDRVLRGKVLGTRSTSHVHLSLDNRYKIGTLCKGPDRCFLPVPFDGQHTIEGMVLDPDPNGETVTLPYSLCNQRKNISCQFKVRFQQNQGLKGTSSNIAIP